MSYVQHYSGEQGGATNLIDFTESAMVALYFACRCEPDTDGRIIVTDRQRFKRREDDLDPSCRETHSIRPPFSADTRNINQWSHFIYTRDGFLHRHEYEVISVPRRHKSAICEHLGNCGISTESVFTSIQSTFEGQGFDRPSRNRYYLGLTMEWLGDEEQAKQLYHQSWPNETADAAIRHLELEAGKRDLSYQDAVVLSRALSSKESVAFSSATCRAHEPAADGEIGPLWRTALAATRVCSHVAAELHEPPTPKRASALFRALGQSKLRQGKADSNDGVVGEASCC